MEGLSEKIVAEYITRKNSKFQHTSVLLKKKFYCRKNSTKSGFKNIDTGILEYFHKQIYTYSLPWWCNHYMRFSCSRIHEPRHS